MIKRAGLAIFVLIVLSVSLEAADAPRAELFGGYSFLHAGDVGENAHGWNASVAGNVSSWFGLVADVSGHYTSASATVPQLGQFTANGDTLFFLFGPRLTLRRAGPVEPFVQTLVGAARFEASAGAPLVGSVGVSDTGLAASIGGGLDVGVGPWVAFRMLQVDYIYTRFLDESQNNLRISVGLVLRFGL